VAKPIRILLQTTISTSANDWHIARFSLLHQYLAELRDSTGQPLCAVVSRDRASTPDDPILSRLDQSDFDELWLFAVDVGDGISPADCQGITAFWQRGGGILATRDHMDLGSSLCTLGGLGAVHFFHSKNPDPDPERHCIDDPYTPYISYPNYHSGRNGDYQVITRAVPDHELLRNPESPSGYIEFFPAHPHEGAVGVTEQTANAQVIATGQSVVTGKVFNLAVAFESALDAQGHRLGRAVAESTFHHFCDYNWDPDLGCPSFVSEPVGDRMKREPRAIADIHAYVRNLALWLQPCPADQAQTHAAH
jgi:hypothetical protein